MRDRMSHVRFVLIAVGSEGDASRARATEAGWDYVEAPNEPLGAKHNAGMELFKRRDVAGVITIGSDDLFNDAYMRILATHAQMGVDAFRMRGIHFYDTTTGRLIYAPTFISGAGRYFSAKTLATRSWRPWPDNRKTKLDGTLDKLERLGRTRWVHGDRDFAMIDIKTSTNMWSFEKSIDLALHGVLDVDDQLSWWNLNFPQTHAELTRIQHSDGEKLFRPRLSAVLGNECAD